MIPKIFSRRKCWFFARPVHLSRGAVSEAASINEGMRSAPIIGFATLGLIAFTPLVSAATGKPAEKDDCVIHVQTVPRTLITASLRACPLKRALYLLESQGVAISRYPDPLGSALLTHSFERLPVHEALQRMFAPYNYILYAESGRVHLEIIGLLSNDPNPSAPATPLSPQITAHPSSIPPALIRPSRRSRIQSDNAKQIAPASEVSISPPIEVRVEAPSEVKVETFDFRITDDEGRKLPPFVPNAAPPTYDHSIAARGLPSAPLKSLPSFTPITNKTGPVIQGPAPKPLPVFTPDTNNTGPK